MDKLDSMFDQQCKFMQLLKEKRGLPDFPADMSSKTGQQACREAGLSGVEEFFEALQHLKNWKKHRATEVRELDHEAFVEECSDAFHYFIEVMIFAGVSADDLYRVFTAKNVINTDRINNGY